MLSALYFVGNKKFVFNYLILYLVVTFKVYDYFYDTVKSQSDDLNPDTLAPFNGGVSKRWYFVSCGCNVASHLSNCTEYIERECSKWCYMKESSAPPIYPSTIEIYSSIDDKIDSHCSHLY